MTKLSVLAAILVLPVSAAPCLSEGTQTDGKLISEETVRAASAELYSDILIQACRNGWRYPRSQIENGFKRHFEELKLQLIDQGYTVVPDMTANEADVQRTILGSKSQLVGSRQFGCPAPTGSMNEVGQLFRLSNGKVAPEAGRSSSLASCRLGMPQTIEAIRYFGCRCSWLLTPIETVMWVHAFDAVALMSQPLRRRGA